LHLEIPSKLVRPSSGLCRLSGNEFCTVGLTKVKAREPKMLNETVNNNDDDDIDGKNSNEDARPLLAGDKCCSVVLL